MTSELSILYQSVFPANFRFNHLRIFYMNDFTKLLLSLLLSSILIPTLFFIVRGITALLIKRGRFKDRDNLSLEELYNQYAHFSSQRVKFYWQAIGQFLDINWQKLRPSDRFDTELREVFNVADNNEFLLDEVSFIANEKDVDISSMQFNTLEDVLLFFLKYHDEDKISPK